MNNQNEKININSQNDTPNICKFLLNNIQDIIVLKNKVTIINKNIY